MQLQNFSKWAAYLHASSQPIPLAYVRRVLRTLRGETSLKGSLFNSRNFTIKLQVYNTSIFIVKKFQKYISLIICFNITLKDYL